MATDSQIAANRENALLSTGPRTEEGRQASSRNALIHGLFTQRDFVRPEEQAEHAQLCEAFLADLQPEGPLEHTYASAIISATWRLRRCAKVEAGLVEVLLYDPMEDVNGEAVQKSVDRARGQAFSILRHSTAELRPLQTERAVRKETGAPDAGLTSHREVVRIQEKLASNCKAAQQVARNAECPCGSGEKYKRCCLRGAQSARPYPHEDQPQPENFGQDAQPVLGPVEKAA